MLFQALQCTYNTAMVDLKNSKFNLHVAIAQKCTLKYTSNNQKECDMYMYKPTLHYNLLSIALMYKSEYTDMIINVLCN